MIQRKLVVLATRNIGKIEELKRILTAAEIEIDILGLKDFPEMPDVEETGKTFAENALLKANQISEYTGLPALADDSGICIDALGGAPGIYSARWAGSHGDDQANLEKVLAELRELNNPALGAQFKCAVALVIPKHQNIDKCEIVREAEIVGEIVMEPRGLNGFGYDPIFQPDGFTRTTAELSAEIKDRISHRGKALAAMIPEFGRLT